MDDISIAINGIEKLISLNRAKASDLDGISPRVLKELAKEALPS